VPRRPPGSTSGAVGASIARVRRLAVLIVLVLAALAIAAGCGSDDPEVVDAGTVTQRAAGSFEGGLVEPRRQAPQIRLRDVDGKLVDLHALAGKPVLLSFIYSQCPDTCPLTMQALREVRDELGAGADDIEIVLVSADPEGDTPEHVRDFLANYDMTGHASYLLGTQAELEPIWAAYQVEREIQQHSHEGTALHEHNHAGLINHASLTFGVDASGRLSTAYPVDFPVSAILHDIPLLAAS
jgi:protein SCO1